MTGTWRVIGLCMAGALLAGLGAGCAKPKIPEPPNVVKKDYYRALPPGAYALRKITDPAQIPDFRPEYTADRESLLTALDHSISYFQHPSSQKYYPMQDISHTRAAASLILFRDTLSSANSADDFQQRVVSSFDVYISVGCDDEGTVQFTGYYTPIFSASLTPTAEYCYPLYKMPADLVKGPEGECLGRKLPDGSLVPYYTRAEVDSGAVSGNELVYLKDPFEAYVCTVQGSAQLRLPSGEMFKIGYAANNGREYTSIGLQMVQAGDITPEQLTLAGLIRYFKAHPNKLAVYVPHNERYVFFEKTDAPPTGSLGVPVTPYRSIATDKSIFPRGCLAFVETHVPSVTGGAAAQQPFARFALDQDTGGGIRAAGRCDIYVGIGDEAGEIAGGTMNEGRLYYLFIKEGADAQ